MKGIVLFVVLAGVIGSPAVAQQRTVTINRHDSFSYRNKTAENLGYATMGLTAFLALLDSGTGARQNGVPVPGYPTIPRTGSRRLWRRVWRCGGDTAASGLRRPVVVHMAVTAGAGSWC